MTSLQRSQNFYLTVSDSFLNIFNYTRNELSKLPILDVQNKNGSTDYIDYLFRDDLNNQNILVGVDKFNRCFIVFNNKTSINKNAYVFFQRYSDDKNYWTTAGKHLDEEFNGCGGISLIKERNNSLIQTATLDFFINEIYKQLKKNYDRKE
jgi:hypothetical protein